MFTKRTTVQHCQRSVATLPLPLGEGRGEGAACCVLRTGRGFTLVEMLVVITIIAILAALTTRGVFSALTRAHTSRMQTETLSLGSALLNCLTTYRAFPPSDLTDATAVEQFLAKAFPRCNPATEYAAIVALAGGNLSNPGEALVIWLQGPTVDPTQPFSGTGTRKPLYDFDTSRITANGYIPLNANNQPYVYIAAPSYLNSCLTDTTATAPPNVVPYMQDGWDRNSDNKLDSDNNTDLAGTNPEVALDSSGNIVASSFQAACANPKSFQLIAPGLDGNYGAASKFVSVKVNGVNKTLWYKSYPSGIGYDTGNADNDNVTNFSEKQLGDAIP